MSVHPYTTKDGTRWQVRWREANGKLRTRSLTSKRDALAFAADVGREEEHVELEVPAGHGGPAGENRPAKERAPQSRARAEPSKDQRGEALVEGRKADHEALLEVPRTPRRAAVLHPRNDDIPHLADSTRIATNAIRRSSIQPLRGGSPPQEKRACCDSSDRACFSHAKGTLSADAVRAPKHGLEGYCGGVVAGEDQNLAGVRLPPAREARQHRPWMNGSWSVSLRLLLVDRCEDAAAAALAAARRDACTECATGIRGRESTRLRPDPHSL
jgi:hypothetical protein